MPQDISTLYDQYIVRSSETPPESHTPPKSEPMESVIEQTVETTVTDVSDSIHGPCFPATQTVTVEKSSEKDEEIRNESVAIELPSINDSQESLAPLRTPPATFATIGSAFGLSPLTPFVAIPFG